VYKENKTHSGRTSYTPLSTLCFFTSELKHYNQNIKFYDIRIINCLTNKNLRHLKFGLLKCSKFLKFKILGFFLTNFLVLTSNFVTTLEIL